MNTAWRLVAAAVLFVVMAAKAAAPLPAPNLADRVFRSGPDVVSSSAINVIGIGPTGNIYVAGPFDSIDGQSRPHGVTRLLEDGELDTTWSPSLPPGLGPTRARESAAGAVALTLSFSGISRQALVLVPAGSSTGTEVDSTSNGYNELVFDDNGTVFVAVYGATTDSSSTGERPIELYKLSASGIRDATFELTLHGDYNNCRFFSPALPNVNAMLPLDGFLYIGGNFTSATNSRGGVGIGGALRVSASTGDPDSSWAPMNSTSPLAAALSAEKLTCFPNPSGVVGSMVAAGGKLYLGGWWERQGRKYLARFSLTGPGGVDPAWNPQIVGGVSGLALDPSGSHVYVSGSFMTIGDVNRTGLAAISTSDASLAPGWDPNVAGPTSISVMRATSNRLVIGGIFTTVHGVERVRLAGLPLVGALSNFSVLQLSPTRIDFGNVAVETSATRAFTIGNPGTAALPIQSITAPGAFASDGPTVTQTNDCPSTLATGASCTVTVRLDQGRYHPGGEPLVVVTPGDGGTVQYVRLAWTLAYPQFNIEGGNGDFASILVPPTPLGYSFTATRTVRNSGTYPLAITGVGIESQSGAGAFSQPTHDCPASLAPAATCTISITYTPSTAGSAQAVMTVSFGTLTYYPYFNTGSYGFTRTGRINVAASSASGTDDSDSDGMPNSVEQAEGRNPVVRDNDIFGISRLFAMQQYRDFLAREGDAGGIAYWTGQVDSGARSRGQVIEYFLGSPEFQGMISPVARLYFAYFLRVPDYSGITFWIGRYRAGDSLDFISNFFAGSAEFQSRYGSLSNAQFVDLVYQNILGRSPDPSGRAFWTAELDSGRRTRGQVMLGFSESPEYRSLSNSEVYVTMIYIGMLRRVPDPSGFAFWVNYLDQGNSVLALINGILGSAEYRARFLP